MSLKFELEFVDDPTGMTRFGMQTDGKTRSKRCERSLRRIGRGVVAEKARRLIHDVRREVADVVGVAELAFGHRLAFQGLDDLWIRFAVGDQLLEPLLVDWGEAAGKCCFLGDRSHRISPWGQDTERSVSCMKRARSTPPGKREVPKPVSPPGLESGSADLLNRNAFNGARDQFARSEDATC